MARACVVHWKISIHALREEGDLCPAIQHNRDVFISIHALREEGDIQFVKTRAKEVRFLSTPSARRATHRRL